MNEMQLVQDAARLLTDLEDHMKENILVIAL